MTCSRRRFLAAGASALAAMPVSKAGAVPAAAGAAVDASAEPTAPRGRPMFRYNNGRFRILQFTDLHNSYSTKKEYAKAEKTLDRIRLLLEQEKPDLAVITGDIIVNSGGKTPVGCELLEGGVAEGWARFTKPFEEAQVPFVTTFGNHDHDREKSVSAKEQLEMIRRSPMSRVYNADDSLPGAGNCSIPILGSDGTDAVRLWFIDSLSYPKRRELSSCAWIDYSQIQWYRRESANIETLAGRKVPGLMFFHIPVLEFNQMRDRSQTFGHYGEDADSSELNSGLFTSLIERGDVLGIFTGHDHNNDSLLQYKGIVMAYGRKTGYGGYGPHDQGGRLIELVEGSDGYRTCIVTPGRTDYPWYWRARPRE
ncbi:MAG: metallophosphoesterase family protein [Thermoguttaceae bacterium]|nr:metallophosphoesterase family protein [Thermoguttaceae bacterium]